MDRELRFQLLRAAVKDRLFLKQAWRDLRPQDFLQREESVIAEAATKFYEKHEEPVGVLLRSELEESVRLEKFGAEAKKKLKDLVDKILSPEMTELVPVKALVDRIRSLRRNAFYDQALVELEEAHDKGELTPGMLVDLVEKANRELAVDKTIAHSYMDELSKRIERRKTWDDRRYPLFLIDGLDERIKGLGRGQFGIWVAPPNSGKGPALLHMDVAYAIQGLNVLHITLEDPQDVVEDRLDASLTGIPLDKLRLLPNKFRKRWLRISKTLKGRIKIIDGTDGGWTMTRVEKVWHELRRDGFVADVIVVDYDDEIECEVAFKGEHARRFQFAEIYRRMRKLAKNLDVILWSAAQSTKATVGRKIIGMGDLAEDFSKARKAFIAIGIGKDPEVENLQYLYVMRHRTGRKGFSVQIMSRFEAGIFYDRDRTMKYYKETKQIEE